jgi:hypothetical protein
MCCAAWERRGSGIMGVASMAWRLQNRAAGARKRDLGLID